MSFWKPFRTQFDKNSQFVPKKPFLGKYGMSEKSQFAFRITLYFTKLFCPLGRFCILENVTLLLRKVQKSKYHYSELFVLSVKKVLS